MTAFKALKQNKHTHSAGEPREKTFSVQFRLFREFGPVLQKGTICLGLALSRLFEGDRSFHVPDGRYFQKHKWLVSLYGNMHPFVLCYWSLVTFATSKKPLRYGYMQS